jgi:hypothetical protein
MSKVTAPNDTRADSVPSATAPPSRRALFGAGAALFGGGVVLAATARAAATQVADAELIALGREFQEIDGRLMALNGAEDTPANDTLGDAVHREWWRIVDQIEELPACTRDGLAVKARTLAAVIRDCAGAEEPECRHALSLVRDLVAGVAA